MTPTLILDDATVDLPTFVRMVASSSNTQSIAPAASWAYESPARSPTSSISTRSRWISRSGSRTPPTKPSHRDRLTMPSLFYPINKTPTTTSPSPTGGAAQNLRRPGQTVSKDEQSMGRFMRDMRRPHRSRVSNSMQAVASAAPRGSNPSPLAPSPLSGCARDSRHSTSALKFVYEVLDHADQNLACACRYN